MEDIPLQTSKQNFKTDSQKIYDLNKTLKSKTMKKSEVEAIISLRKQIIIEIMNDITELIEMKDE